MRSLHKTTLAAVTGLGVIAFASIPALAAADGAAATDTAAPPPHMAGGQGSEPCPAGAGMMGGAGAGKAGAGMAGHAGSGKAGAGKAAHAGGGMMGQGQGMKGHMGGAKTGGGMMGHMGQGAMASGMRVTPVKDLTTDDVRHFLEHRIRLHDNKRLKVGEVKQADEDTITAAIVTLDDSIVKEFKVDLHTGQLTAVE